jgi:hypothetical protein
MMLVVEVVVVVGCFAASAAPLHLDFDQNIPNPPYAYGRVEYAGNPIVVRPPSEGQNDNDCNNEGTKLRQAMVCSCTSTLSYIPVQAPWRRRGECLQILSSSVIIH